MFIKQSVERIDTDTPVSYTHLVGGDGAGQGAAVAVGVAVGDALAPEPLAAAVPPQQVVGVRCV